ncbi:hypothetical protein [Microbispora sp. H10836]|uniref:hypothetical protein n=1 Tax=Microbispora sp. H10836 TaxID=2729106 RepID=UPI0014749A69|nr:hypothetical protein [Microbispora sp. H10836]
MPYSIARSRDEAHLYLDLNPCACGSAGTDWDSGLASAEGELVTCYEGRCAACGAEREYLFGLPEREVTPTGYPTFGGAEPSELLDPGEWMWVADLTAGNVPEGPLPEGGERRQALSIARAAVEEVIKFVPPGQDEVPEEAFWSERGRAVRAAEPGRFRLDRLLVVRDTYRELAGA